VRGLLFIHKFLKKPSDDGQLWHGICAGSIGSD